MMPFEQEHKKCAKVWRSLQLHLNANTKEMQKKSDFKQNKQTFWIKDIFIMLIGKKHKKIL
jgi:hypothetical protein